MALLTEYQRSIIKIARERTYDTNISVIRVTSSPDSGDAYGKTTTKTTSTTVILASVSYGQRYGFRSLEAGLIEDGDLIVTTSLDNEAIITASKAHIEINSDKYSIGQIEVYSEANEMVVRCKRLG